MQSVHEGIKYDCNVCEYKVTRRNSLLRHVKSEHEGFKYYIIVRFVYTMQLTKYKFWVHVKSVHEGGKYDCHL